MSARLLALVLILALSGCTRGDYGEADFRILWDRDGCAFNVDPGAGDTSFVRRLPDADRETCPAEDRTP